VCRPIAAKDYVLCLNPFYALINLTIAAWTSSVAIKGGTTNLKVVGGVNALEGGARVNTVKTLTFEKGWWCMTLTPQLLWGCRP